MRLRLKVFLILSANVVLLACVVYWILNFTIFPEFVFLEHDEAKEDLNRAKKAIEREIHHLDTFCWDWSSWDDTYDFVETQSKDYVETNLTLNTFTDNGINLIYIIDLNGNVVWGEIYDLETEEKLFLRDFPTDVFPKSHPLISFNTEKSDLSQENVSGVFMTEQGAWLMASRPVLTTNNEGPARGSLILGRLLSEDIVKALADQTQTSFEIFPIHEKPLPEALREIPDQLSADSPYLIEEQGDDLLRIYTTYPDIKGNPILLIEAEISKKISAKGHSTINYSLVFIMVSMLALLVVILLLLQRTVLRPLADLTNHALVVGETGDLSSHLSIQRRDEIGMLAQEFDGMLVKLEERAKELEAANQGLKKEVEDRKKAEEALRESEARYRVLIEKYDSPINVYGPDGTLLIMNPAAAEGLGGKPEDFIGKKLPEYFPDGEYLLERHQKIMKTGQAAEFEDLFTLPSGKRWFLSKLQPITKENGEIFAIHLVAYDISEQKQAEKEKSKLEAQLRQAYKMEAIGTLAGGIAHEFNNILGIIIVNAELAMDRMVGSNTARHNLEEIRIASLRARDVVKQILAFSRQTKKELKPVRLKTVTAESLRLVRSSIPTSIKIHEDFSCKFDTISADSTEINQVVINLCTNAAHAMRDEGGVLKVSLENLQLDKKTAKHYNGLAPGNYVKLTVSDTGSGMEPETMDRIFDPYFTTKEVGEGTGMGLSVVHGIVKNHGGEIIVQSEPGKGSAFQVLFPLVREEAKTEPEPEKPSFKGSERILLVDDEESLVFAAKYKLGELGYKVVAMKNPVKALDVFKERPESFDLVITDMTMPEMMGDIFAEEIMKIRSDIPVILSTGYSEHISEEKAKEMGIKAFIMKPILMGEMASTIRLVLDQAKGILQ